MIQISEIEEVLNSVFHPEYERSVMELSLVQNLEYKSEGNDEDKLLWARNKWLIAHPESSEAASGAYVGLTGKNLDIAVD